MRIRTIKPEFWTDSLLVSMARDTRLLYIGLWNASDDHGWLPDDAVQLKMLLFPGDADFEIEMHLEILIAAERIERHLHDTGSVLRITHWSDHQKVDHPGKSKLFREGSRKLAIPFETRRGVALKYGCKPGGTMKAKCYFCDDEGVIHWHKLRNGKPSSWVTFSELELDHFVAESRDGEATTDNIVLSCRHCNRSKGSADAIAFLCSTREGSRGLAPDQGSGNGPGKGMEVERNGEESGNEPPPQPKPAIPDSFDQFWQAYPNKTGKANALKIWERDKPNLETVLAALAWQKRQDYWTKDNGKFIPHASTYLNGKRYEDEKPKPPPRESCLGLSILPDPKKFSCL